MLAQSRAQVPSNGHPKFSLEAAGLACVRGRRTLFRDLSFALAPGELVRIAGDNGSGKTSLLRILCGLLAPAAGEVRWNGEPIGELGEAYAAELLYLGHAPALKDDLTAAENLRFARRIAGDDADQQAVREALAELGLPDPDMPVKKLSQGQRRRVALARLALPRPPVLWLLDEPFAALDPGAARRVEALIQAHLGAGGAVAYTTHQPSGLDAGVTRVVALGEGGAPGGGA
ncbi:MAG TPA: cytochrome c biogenesis heme-transporting ATPase CcmA [Burkholderiales bacterium]|nr:cytochrome c biogenesis heme-transporting ATPase CcmA [Burkholderiales bacterium]